MIIITVTQGALSSIAVTNALIQIIPQRVFVL